MGALVLFASALPACSSPETESTAESARVESVPADTSPPATVATRAAPVPAAPAGPQGGQGLDQSELFVVLEPVGKGETPADLLVLDPNGGRTGVEPGTFRILPTGEKREAALRNLRIRSGEVQRFSFVYAREGGTALAITRD